MSFVEIPSPKYYAEVCVIILNRVRRLCTIALIVYSTLLQSESTCTAITKETWNMQGKQKREAYCSTVARQSNRAGVTPRKSQQVIRHSCCSVHALRPIGNNHTSHCTSNGLRYDKFVAYCISLKSHCIWFRFIFVFSNLFSEPLCLV